MKIQLSDSLQVQTIQLSCEYIRYAWLLIIILDVQTKIHFAGWLTRNCDVVWWSKHVVFPGNIKQKLNSCLKVRLEYSWLALCPSFKFSFSWYNIRKRRIPVLVNSSFEQRNFMGSNSYVMRLCMHHWTTVFCPSMKHSMVTLSVERYPERKMRKNTMLSPRFLFYITHPSSVPYIIADLTTNSRVPWSYPFMDLVIPQPRKNMDTYFSTGKTRKVGGGKRGYLVTPCEEQKRSHKPSLILLTFATSSPVILRIRSYPI